MLHDQLTGLWTCKSLNLLILCRGKNGSKTKLALKVNAMQKLKSQETAACCFFSHEGSSLSLH